jgi:hypothetical protein
MKKGIIANDDGNAKLELKKSSNNIEIIVSYVGFKEYKIKLRGDRNYNLKIYLTNIYNGTPIMNRIDTLNISDYSDKYFKLKSKDNKAITWNKIK